MSQSDTTLPHDWAPRDYQDPLWEYLAGGGKRAVALWPRRSGKDEVFLHYTAVSASKRKGSYWYLLPEYAQARKSMWDAINPKTGRRRIDDAFPQFMRETTREQEMMIVFRNGSTFQLVGSDNFNSLVGSPPVGLVFSEFALSNPNSWSYLMPILEENGGWAGFNSTPRGRNHFYNLCMSAQKMPGWFYQKLTADETGVFTKQQLADILQQLQDTHGKEYGAALFQQEYYASFDAAIPGSIWGDCIDRMQTTGRLGEVPIEPNVAVNTAWDLGSTDATAIWWYQVFAGEVRVVGYHESNFKDIPFYADVLRKWAKERGVAYGTHWLPHDARARTLAAGGKSIQQQMIDQDVGRIAIAKRLDLQDQIQAARATFPRVWMDESACADGLECLRAYHREWDEEKRIFVDRPVHDWSSHGSSAWMTMCVSWKASREPGANDALDTVPDERGSLSAVSMGSLVRRHLRQRRTERLNQR